MSTCDHEAKFTFRQVFSRLPEYTCKKCGEPVAMAPNTKKILSVINIIFIILLVGVAIGGSQLGYGMVGFILYLIGMLILLALFMLLNALVTRYGTFLDISRPGKTEKNNEETAKSETPVDTSGFTEEQRHIMELYNSYAKKNEGTDDVTPAGDDSVNSSGTPTYTSSSARVTSAVQTKEHVIEDHCEHKPRMTWRAFLPGNNEFICEKCEAAIVFQEDRKRILNIILIIISFIALALSFNQQLVDMTMLLIAASIALVLAVIIQLIFIKTSRFDLLKNK